MLEAIGCEHELVGWFSPARKVTAPDGREWEIYVSQAPLPPWRPSAYQGSAFGEAGTPFDVVVFLLEIPLFFFNQLLLPLVRFLVDLPSTALRGRRSQTVTIEAICFGPRNERWVWTAARDHRDRVVDQIAGAFARGEPAQPLGAEFKGHVR